MTPEPHRTTTGLDTDRPPAVAHGRPSLSAGAAWRAVALMAGLRWVVRGLGCFGAGVQVVYDRMGTTLNAALALDLVFLVGVAIVIAVVRGWLRRDGDTFRDVGWRAPYPPWVMLLAVVFGLAWTAMSYARGGDPLELSWQRPIMVAVGPVLAFGEEIAVRGFMMDRLQRAAVPAWVQIVVTGVIMGAYHGLIGWHYAPPYAVSSFVLFALVSALFVASRRSLTPAFVAHSMTHVLGDPALMRGILYGAQALR